MIKYRFYEYDNGIKHYLMFDGDDYVPTEERSKATLFTDKEWKIWGNDGRIQREEIGQDEAMRLAGMEELPGILAAQAPA